MTETLDMATGSGVVTTPDSKVLPKRNGHRGMLPTSWLGRTLRVEYVDADGKGRTTSGKFLDYCGAGIVLGSHDGWRVLSFDYCILYELVPD